MHPTLRLGLLAAALAVAFLQAPSAWRALSDSVRGPWALPSATSERSVAHGSHGTPGAGAGAVEEGADSAPEARTLLAERVAPAAARVALPR